jgi:hypothetical protein
VAKTPAPASNDAPVEPAVIGSGKGRATPSRAEQEAARKRPLVADTKEAKQRARGELQAAREKARAGMAAGEERYLPVRDKGPQRRFARDFVDAGFHLGEGVMPFMVLVIVATLIPVAAMQTWSFLALWAYIILVIIDMVITSVRVKRAARAKFGESRLEKGLGFYAAMRTVQMRFMRLPKPQVKRGQRPA